MLRPLELPQRNTTMSPYSLQDPSLPMGLVFAQRRTYADHLARAGATSSDGQTSGNDGNDPADHEEFDFIQDD